MVLRLRLPILLAISFILFNHTSLTAQIKSAYSIGSVGMTGSSMSIYSGPIVVSSKSCFAVNNGVIDFAIAKQGVFNSNCLVSSPIIPVTITYNSYPNPVASSFIIKANNVSATDVSPVLLEFVAMDGRIISKQSTNMQTLSSGYSMSASQLSKGEYVIKVFSNNQPTSTLKIIKAY